MLRAIARFELPGAKLYLRRVAREGDGSIARFAIMILAQWGDVDGMRALVDDELSLYESHRQSIFGIDAERLAYWPPALVREALLVRIRQGGTGTARWLFLLRWFATEEDIELFERFEKDENEAVADIAHEFLRGDRVRAYRKRVVDR